MWLLMFTFCWRNFFLKTGGAEVEKRDFHYSKNVIPIRDVNTDKIVISEKLPCPKKSSKYFVSYKNNEGVTPCYFFLLKKWVGMWNTLTVPKPCLFWSKIKNYGQNVMEYGVKLKKSYKKKKLDSYPMFGYKYLETKIKSYDNKITKNFHGKATMEGIKCVCLSVISTDVFRRM